MPWKQSNCCYESTISSVRKLNDNYGPGFQWDRCGKLTPACEQFFVQESCMYECDVNAGLFRKCSEANVTAAASNSSDPCLNNTWEIKGMPIKASYCDAWFRTCFNDQFCGGNDGNFFSCAAYYSESQLTPAPTSSPTSSGSTGLSTGVIITIVVLSVFILVVLLILGVTFYRERHGDPILKPLLKDGESSVPRESSRNFPETELRQRERADI
jgi:folate receptor